MMAPVETFGRDFFKLPWTENVHETAVKLQGGCRAMFGQHFILFPWAVTCFGTGEDAMGRREMSQAAVKEVPSPVSPAEQLGAVTSWDFAHPMGKGRRRHFPSAGCVQPS